MKPGTSLFRRVPWSIISSPLQLLLPPNCSSKGRRHESLRLQKLMEDFSSANFRSKLLLLNLRQTFRGLREISTLPTSWATGVVAAGSLCSMLSSIFNAATEHVGIDPQSSKLELIVDLPQNVQIWVIFAVGMNCVNNLVWEKWKAPIEPL